MPLAKTWQPWPPATARAIPSALGVFEIGDAAGNVLYIGMAGGRTRFGLRERISACFAGTVAPSLAERAVAYRYEVNMMYLTRYIDLLERYLHAYGELPPGNRESGEPLPRLGRAGRQAARTLRAEDGGN
jgi:hypothetical protein